MKNNAYGHSIKAEVGDHFSKFLNGLDPELLLGIIPRNVLQDLSFYNFHNTVTACFFVDRNLIVQEVNETFRGIFQSSQLAVEGMPLAKMFESIGIPKEVRDDFKAQMKQQGFVKIPQIEIVSKGETHYFSLFSTITRFKDITPLYGVQGQFIDRTKEVLLRKRQEALAGQIRHDMKNRIAATLMGSDAVLQEWEMLKSTVQLPEEMIFFIENMEETLKEIYGNSDYLSKLVIQMLDISKLQSGQLALQTSTFDLKEALSQVVNALKPQQEAGSIAVEIPDLSIEIEADFVQLSRVLENYHSNALKYTQSKITWSFQQEGDAILIVVQDDGEGIAPEYLTRIFDPFFQVPGKEKAGSTGLGLDSVNDLVKLHGGTTWAESDGAGLGSRFCLRIPLLQQQ